MKAEIKALAEAITNGQIKKIIEGHVKELIFDKDTEHLVIYVDNAAPKHELESEEGDHHLNSGLVEVYGDDITYEIRMHGQGSHEREKQVPHNIKH